MQLPPGGVCTCRSAAARCINNGCVAIDTSIYCLLLLVVFFLYGSIYLETIYSYVLSKRFSHIRAARKDRGRGFIAQFLLQISEAAETSWRKQPNALYLDVDLRALLTSAPQLRTSILRRNSADPLRLCLTRPRDGFLCVLCL